MRRDVALTAGRLAATSALMASALLVFARAVGAQATDRSELQHPRDGLSLTIRLQETQSSSGRSLADFLAGRVSGLIVAYESGQPSAAPRIVGRASYGTYAAPEPLLYIDGVLWRDDPHWWSGSQNRATPPSLGWALPVEEIEDVRIHLGAASGGELEFGASRGAVFVTTRRPETGRTRVRAGLQATSSRLTPSVGTNAGTLGFVGAPTDAWRCTLYRQAAGTCTATGPTSWAPLPELVIPVTAQGLRANVSASGALLRWAYRASAVHDAMDGSFSTPSTFSRTDLGFVVASPTGGRLSVGLDTRFARIESRMTDLGLARVGVASVASMAIPNDSLRALLDTIRDIEVGGEPDRATARITVGANAQLRLTDATRIEVRASYDEIGRGAARSYLIPDGSGGTTTRAIDGDFAALTSGGALTVRHGRLLAGGPRLDAFASTSFTRTRFVDQYSDEVLAPPSGIAYETTEARELASVLLGSNLLFGTRASLATSFRVEALQGERVTPTLKSISGSWYLVRGREGITRGLSSLTLLGGYGESADHRASFARSALLTRPGSAEISTERDVRLIARWSERFETSAGRALTTVVGGAMHGYDFFSTAQNVYDDQRWRVDATTFRMGARAVAGARRPWTLDLSAMKRDASMESSPIADYFESFGSNVLAYVEGDSPIFGLAGVAYTFGDPNGDGIIESSEVVLGANYVFRQSEPRWLLSLQGRLEVSRVLVVGGVVESRLGQTAFDELEVRRCNLGMCRALHDSSTSLSAQAAAVALDAHQSAAGFLRDASFARVRELFVEYAPAQLRGARVSLAAHQLLVWSRQQGRDPEPAHLRGAIRTGLLGPYQGIAPSVSLRVDLAP